MSGDTQKACKNCRHCLVRRGERYEEDLDAVPKRPMLKVVPYETFTCRRYPPVNLSGFKFGPEQPRVGPYDVCGEFIL